MGRAAKDADQYSGCTLSKRASPPLGPAARLSPLTHADRARRASACPQSYAAPAVAMVCCRGPFLGCRIQGWVFGLRPSFSLVLLCPLGPPELAWRLQTHAAAPPQAWVAGADQSSSNSSFSCLLLPENNDELLQIRAAARTPVTSSAAKRENSANPSVFRRARRVVSGSHLGRFASRDSSSLVERSFGADFLPTTQAPVYCPRVSS